ncbi:OsmC family peroxiredoxin [Pseudooceanicola sp. 216_PA32_1]|uniref:OsmC family peroxiredoxin n=1 Tax=Pseudooceanicola pacificus TaxID=2676438 RepID=A0A844W9G4_9RHOB|nr:OsmC family protein [Pseudooceanicola pacificus]MWB79591.1 OsmC family peroxiredoxin [Pseudooceanicola pacificus]
MKRSGSAVWSGDLKTGKGTVSAQSGILDKAQYGFNTRFEDGPGTNPEELIGAAHAGCFSMALSNILGEYDLVADEIATKATVSLEQKDGGFTITKVHLEVTARIPGATAETFAEAAGKAKAGCPVSKLLTAEITMNATLA